MYEGVIAYNLEPYSELIEGYCYAHSIYGIGWNFFINILAIQDICYISLHPTSDPEKVLGIIDVNLNRKKEGKPVCEMAC